VVFTVIESTKRISGLLKIEGTNPISFPNFHMYYSRRAKISRFFTRHISRHLLAITAELGNQSTVPRTAPPYWLLVHHFGLCWGRNPVYELAKNYSKAEIQLGRLLWVARGNNSEIFQKLTTQLTSEQEQLKTHFNTLNMGKIDKVGIFLIVMTILRVQTKNLT
jgi:hypothetical protein